MAPSAIQTLLPLAIQIRILKIATMTMLAFIRIRRQILLILILNVFLLSAQSSVPPPDCPDPDIPCPIDNWIIYLAAGAFIFAVINLHRKNKRISSAEGTLDNKI